MAILADILKKARGEMTLGQIAQKSGIDKGYLSKVERNERKPKPDMLEKLARAYAVDYHTLMVACGYLDSKDASTETNDKKPQVRMVARKMEAENLTDSEIAEMSNFVDWLISRRNSNE